MDLVVLSRLQFAITVFFHFIFVPLTLGLAVIVASIETLYVRTGNQVYKRMAKFWGKLFLINFALGIVTGITLEFQFGTNWSRYSEFVGDIFGSLLAIEASVTFFLESTFLAVWAFGWERVSKKMHCVAIWLVAIAANLSAFWIILANAFMQNPVGYEIRNGRAELADFWAVAFNEYAYGMFSHTIFASWVLTGFFVLGVAAWHILRKNELDFFKRSFTIGANFTAIALILLLIAGHWQGQIVAEKQPAKLAAMEAIWETASYVPMYALLYPDVENETNSIEALPIPGLLSILAGNSLDTEIKGLKEFPKEERPPVLPVFITFRLMLALGGIFVLFGFLAWYIKKSPEDYPRILKWLPYIIPLPYFAIAFGWTVAEMGRQPWVVYNLMKTTDAVSPVPTSSVLISVIVFGLVYTFLGIVDVYLLRKYACKGPTPVSTN
ncbi:MAG: cytochrome ubiquinol oxidase subunit I [Desulfovibrionaceae bacterium]|nr:cytochrome ubiquinol oxidase subunit I [Desulfovibrionaceae bacterium]